MLSPRETHAQPKDRYKWEPPTGPHVWHLPGFVEDNVTYESHEFWVEFHVWDKKPLQWKIKNRPEATLWVRHGGGVETIGIRHMFARQLRDNFVRSPEDHTASFFTCWGIFELARDAAATERKYVSQRYLRAFASGLMKKRKIPRYKGAYVWLEDSEGNMIEGKHKVAFT